MHLTDVWQVSRRFTHVGCEINCTIVHYSFQKRRFPTTATAINNNYLRHFIAQYTCQSCYFRFPVYKHKHYIMFDKYNVCYA
jgi:hypothetical protein